MYVCLVSVMLIVPRLTDGGALQDNHLRASVHEVTLKVILTRDDQEVHFTFQNIYMYLCHSRLLCY